MDLGSVDIFLSSFIFDTPSLFVIYHGGVFLDSVKSGGRIGMERKGMGNGESGRGIFSVGCMYHSTFPFLLRARKIDRSRELR